MLKSIQAFFTSLLLKIKVFFAKHVPLAETLLQEFLNSDEGKKSLVNLKDAQDKKAAIESILVLLTVKAKALAENNPALTQKILDYLKKKILAQVK